MECPHCGAVDATQIEIRLKGDDSVRFYSCRRCEHSWWKHEDETITLDAALSLTAEKEPAK